jgi:hypothetical protein
MFFLDVFPLIILEKHLASAFFRSCSAQVRMEREYMQLHRDTTVSQLTAGGTQWLALLFALEGIGSGDSPIQPLKKNANVGEIMGNIWGIHGKYVQKPRFMKV